MLAALIFQTVQQLIPHLGLNWIAVFGLHLQIQLENRCTERQFTITFISTAEVYGIQKLRE